MDGRRDDDATDGRTDRRVDRRNAFTRTAQRNTAPKTFGLVRRPACLNLHPHSLFLDEMRLETLKQVSSICTCNEVHPFHRLSGMFPVSTQLGCCVAVRSEVLSQRLLGHLSECVDRAMHAYSRRWPTLLLSFPLISIFGAAVASLPSIPPQLLSAAN